MKKAYIFFLVSMILTNFLLGQVWPGWVAGENGTVPTTTGTSIGFFDNLSTPDYLNIYPNPAKDILNIDFIGDKGIINGELIIFDAHGKRVLNKQIQKEKTSINVAGLEPGLYYIHIKDDQNFVMDKLIIN